MFKANIGTVNFNIFSRFFSLYFEKKIKFSKTVLLLSIYFQKSTNKKLIVIINVGNLK